MHVDHALCVCVCGGLFLVLGVGWGQSNAILNYVGKLAGLIPADPVHALLSDQVLSAIEDFLSSVVGPTNRLGAEEKKAALEALASGTGPGTFPWFLGRLAR